jgi:2-keto-3-deoxy-L-rhamnonate aldolase RhmA
MYLINKIQEKIDKNELIVGANVLFSDSDISELFGFAGCDYVWIDMEHAPLTYKDVEQHIIAAHAGNAAAFVRVPWNDHVMVKRIIDMGPDGIVFPLIRNYDEALAAVKACSFPPKGIRGWNPIRAMQYGCADQDWYVKNAEALVWKILMIEHIDAVNDLERILSIPEVNCIIIGPSDLTGSMGNMHHTNTDEFWKTIKRITDVAKEKKVVIGVAVPTNCPKEILFRWLNYGVQMVSIGQDAFLLSAIIRDNLKMTRETYEEYKNKNK